MRNLIIAKFSHYIYRNNVIIGDLYIIKETYRVRLFKLA